MCVLFSLRLYGDRQNRRNLSGDLSIKLFKIGDSNGWTYLRYSYIHVLLIIATWLYLQFYRCSHNQTWQDSRSTYADFTKQVIIRSTQLGHVIYVSSFMPAFISPIRTKLGRQLGKTACTYFATMMTFSHFGYMKNTYGRLKCIDLNLQKR